MFNETVENISINALVSIAKNNSEIPVVMTEPSGIVTGDMVFFVEGIDESQSSNFIVRCISARSLEKIGTLHSLPFYKIGSYQSALGRRELIQEGDFVATLKSSDGRYRYTTYENGYIGQCKGKTGRGSDITVLTIESKEEEYKGALTSVDSEYFVYSPTQNNFVYSPPEKAIFLHSPSAESDLVGFENGALYHGSTFGQSHVIIADQTVSADEFTLLRKLDREEKREMGGLFI